MNTMRLIDDAKVTARIRKATALAKRAKRAAPLLDVDDARQQCLLTMLEAERRYEPSTTSLEAYVVLAARSQLTTFTWQSTCPVYLTTHALRRENITKPAVAMLKYVELPTHERQAEIGGGASGRRAPSKTPVELQVSSAKDAGEAHLDECRVRERVAALLAEIEPRRAIAYAAVRVLIKESRPKEEALALAEAGYATERVAARRINKAASRIREELMSRPDLLALIRSVA